MAMAKKIVKQDDPISRAVKLVTNNVIALGSYAGSVVALIAVYYSIEEKFPALSIPIVVGIAAVPIFVALLTITLPEWISKSRDKRLIAEGISGSLNDSGYFRIWPYEAADRENFFRPDNAHQEVLNWIQNASNPILYITGRSGSGKSSILNAWVIPALVEDHSSWQVLSVRGYGDPLTALTNSLRQPGMNRAGFAGGSKC